jgi:uncharacterized repeat protein (TIGR03803 family)
MPIGCGTVFTVTPEGRETVLYFFTGGADGGLPTGLIQAADGHLYGTATYGGLVNTATGGRGGGVIFRITGAGSEQVVYSFDGSSGNGANPLSLMQAADGDFYVTTDEGGTGYSGAIVRIAASGAESVLYSFLGGGDGDLPSAPLIQWSDGNFYGVTQFGAASGGGGGTFFQLTPSGQETVLYRFSSNAAGGTYPLTLVAGHGNSSPFFGVASGGGLVSDCGGGCGTVYQITPSGAESALYRFEQEISGNLISPPNAIAVIESSDGTLYGITMSNGVNAGTLFSLSPGGVLTTLHAFGSGTGM